MAIQSFLVGLTYTLSYQFRDSLGVLTNVDSSFVNVYTPRKDLYLNQYPLVQVSTGEYKLDFFAPVGLTMGHWSSIGVGISNGTTLFSNRQIFEIVNIQTEPAWVSLNELRTFLNLSSDDHTNDVNLQQALQASLELVEGYCHRHYGEHRVDEIIEIIDTDRVQLKHFPVNSIVGITATFRTFPRNSTNILIETLDSPAISFYYRPDLENGILKLVDSAGYECVYDGVILSVAYNAGFVSVPEPVRQAVLSLAAQLNALSCSEGIESLRFSDMSFVSDKKLFDGHIKEMLEPFRNNFKI